MPILKVLGHRALHRLPALLLQREPGEKEAAQPRSFPGPQGMGDQDPRARSHRDALWVCFLRAEEGGG